MDGLATRRIDGNTRPVWLAPLALFLATAICAFGAITALATDYHSAHFGAIGRAGLTLLGCAASLAGFTVAAWRQRHQQWRFSYYRSRSFWGGTTVLTGIGYLLLLFARLEQCSHFVLIAIAAAALTVMAWPPIVAPQRLVWVTALMQRRAARALYGLLLVAIVATVFCELFLRTLFVVHDQSMPDRYAASRMKLTPGVDLAGQTVNSLGYWDEEFEVNQPKSRFRVALLGDEAVFSGTAHNNFLAHIEEAMPSLEIYNFAIPQAGPREYAAILSPEVMRFHPDLVLCVISIANDITDEPSRPTIYQWEGLRVYQLGNQFTASARSKRFFASQPPQPAWQGPDSIDPQRYLRESTARLAVCRTPINDELQRCWKRTLEDLERLAAQAAHSEVPLGLVLVPGEFQVNRVLLETLQRRGGYGEAIDLELPQRRLGVFASKHDIPLLDLLPHLRMANEPVHCHKKRNLNDLGNAVAGDAVSRWLEQRFGRQIAAVDITVKEEPVLIAQGQDGRP